MTLFRKFHHLYFLIPIVAYGLLYLVLSQTSLTISHDVSLFLEVGNRILDSQVPYVDFYEINFPLIQYLSAFFVLGSRITGANVIVTTLIMTWILVGWSAVSIHFLTRRVTDNPHLPHVVSTAIIVYFTAIQIPLIGRAEFAQREQLLILLFLPFMLIRIYQWQYPDESNGVWWRFIYGFLAAVGVAIKPHFAIIPVILELYGLSQHKNWRLFLRAEIYGFALFAGLHVLFLIIFSDVRNGLLEILVHTPQYLANTRGNNIHPVITWINHPDLRMTFFIVMIFWVMKYPTEKTRSFMRTLCIVILSGTLVFSLQSGFPYHAIIHQSILWILILYGVTRFFHPPHFEENQDFTLIRNPMVYIIVLLSVYLLGIYANVFVPDNTRFRELTDYQTFIIDHTEKGEDVFVINNSLVNVPNISYPDIHQIDRWVSTPYINNFPFSWGWKDNPTSDEKLTLPTPPLVQQWLERVPIAIEQQQPHLIIIDPDIHRYLAHVGFIEDVIQPDYDLIASEPDFIAYELKAE